MPVKPYANRLTIIGLIFALLSGCFHPPYNNFRKESPPTRRTVTGVGIGAITGAFLGNTIIGAAVGGAAGGVLDAYHTSMKAVLSDLRKNDIEYVQYGDTRVLIVPIDHYFQFNSPKLNDICFDGLNNIIKLLRFYPCSTIYVAAFTDNIGSTQHKRRLSQAQAETMLTFLWAHDIHARHLKAEGHGDSFSIADNQLIHGAALNRRIEIQWMNTPTTQQNNALSGAMK